MGGIFNYFNTCLPNRWKTISSPKVLGISTYFFLSFITIFSPITFQKIFSVMKLKMLNLVSPHSNCLKVLWNVLKFILVTRSICIIVHIPIVDKVCIHTKTWFYRLNNHVESITLLWPCLSVVGWSVGRSVCQEVMFPSEHLFILLQNFKICFLILLISSMHWAALMSVCGYLSIPIMLMLRG